MQPVLREAEDRLHHADIVGPIAQGRLALGWSTRTSWKKADPKEHGAERGPKGRREKLACQGYSREQTGQLDEVKFLLRSVYDVLPTPSNLHTWGVAESPNSVEGQPTLSMSSPHVPQA